MPERLGSALESYQDATQVLARAVAENAKLPPSQRMHPCTLARAVVNSYQYKCNPSRASCRRFIALHKAHIKTKAAAAVRRERTTRALP